MLAGVEGVPWSSNEAKTFLSIKEFHCTICHIITSSLLNYPYQHKEVTRLLYTYTSFCLLLFAYIYNVIALTVIVCYLICNSRDIILSSWASLRISIFAFFISSPLIFTIINSITYDCLNFHNRIKKLLSFFI